MNMRNNFPPIQCIRTPAGLRYVEERKGLRVASIEQTIADCAQELAPRQAVSYVFRHP